MPDDRLSRIEDAEFQRKLDNLKVPVDPAKADELEARIEQHEAATKRAAEAMRQGISLSSATDRKQRAANRSSERTTKRRGAARRSSVSKKPTERELLTAKTADEICAALARYCWAKTHSGEACPTPRIPSWSVLIAWWDQNDSADLREEATRTLSVVMGEDVLWVPWSTGSVAEDARAVAQESDTVLTLVEIHQRWIKLTKPRILHPLAPIVDAWQQRSSEPVNAVDKSNLIMPRSAAHVEPTSSGYYLARFGSAVHREPNGQLLIGFATEGERGPTLPANVWTMGLAAAEKRGAVVPLALRIWVAAILHTPLRARHGRFPVELQNLTLRKFLAWVYTSKASPKPIRYWAPLMAAREVINSTELPFEWRGNLWSRPVVTLATPLTRPALDDPWPVTVHLPPGDGTGPAINFARLQYWSVRNAACYRALINLAYRWHIEGKRLMPANGGNHWLQIRDPNRYDCITDADAEAICYPPSIGAKRRDQRIADAHTALEELVKAGDAVAVDGRLLPPRRRVRTGT